MREMLHSVGGRKPKKGRRTSPPQSIGGLSEEALDQIRALIAAGNAQLREHLDRKWESLEKRCEFIEHALFEERKDTKVLEKHVNEIERENRALRDQLESLDINNSRLDSLILRCRDFGAREPGEDIETKTVTLLSSRLPGLKLSGHDIQAVHRLASENTVKCKFFKRQLRDAIYENRFQQVVRDPKKRLFITESLSVKNKEIMNVLVQAKKRRQVYTAFSRRGLVYVKISRDAASRRVDSLDQLERLMLEARIPGPRPGAALAAGGSAGAPAPPGPGGGRGLGGEEQSASPCLLACLRVRWTATWGRDPGWRCYFPVSRTGRSRPTPRRSGVCPPRVDWSGRAFPRRSSDEFFREGVGRRRRPAGSSGGVECLGVWWRCRRRPGSCGAALRGGPGVCGRALGGCVFPDCKRLTEVGRRRCGGLRRSAMERFR